MSESKLFNIALYKTIAENAKGFGLKSLLDFVFIFTPSLVLEMMEEIIMLRRLIRQKKRSLSDEHEFQLTPEKLLALLENMKSYENELKDEHPKTVTVSVNTRRKDIKFYVGYKAKKEEWEEFVEKHEDELRLI